MKNAEHLNPDIIEVIKRVKASQIRPGDVIVPGIRSRLLVENVERIGDGRCDIFVDTHDGERYFFGPDYKVDTIVNWIDGIGEVA